LARSLWGDPGLVLLDEPTAGLDLGGREQLVARLTELARDPATPPTVLVTHHVEEIPPGFTHALLLRGGRALAAGPLDAVLTAEALGRLFGVPLVLDRRDGRWAARAPHGPAGGARGDEGEQAWARALELVAEQPLDQRADQAAAVVQVHLQPAAALGRADLGGQHPGGVAAAVALGPLEADPPRLVDGPHHAQPLGPGEGAQPAPEVDRPRRPGVVGVGVDRAHPRDDLQPLRVAAQVVDPPERLVGGAGSHEVGRHVHGAIVAPRPGPPQPGLSGVPGRRPRRRAPPRAGCPSAPGRSRPPRPTRCSRPGRCRRAGPRRPAGTAARWS